MKLLYKISIICLLFPIVVFDNDKFKGKYTKEKKMSKEFIVDNDAILISIINMEMSLLLHGMKIAL